MKANFAAAWEELGPTNELVIFETLKTFNSFQFSPCLFQEETYALSSVKTLDEAVKNIIQYLGLQPCERSDKIQEGKSSHTLFLAGKTLLYSSFFLI